MVEKSENMVTSGAKLQKKKQKLEEERSRLKKLQKEITKEISQLRDKEKLSTYRQVMDDEVISWIVYPRVLHKKKGTGMASYVHILPSKRFTDKTVSNPLNVGIPDSLDSVVIVVPDIYVDFSKKIRVTIEPYK